MRTVLITNGNLLSLLSLGDFLRRYHQCIVAVFITTRLPSQRSNVVGVWSMLRRSGWRYTRFKLATNVFLPRRFRRRGLITSVADYLRRLGSPTEIIPAADINDPAQVDRVRAFEPEVLLSFSATTRFKDALLEVPRRVALNAHYALLPAYAGLSPYFWYLRNRERECGVTLHQITPKLDAGPVIEQQRFSMEGLQTVLGVLRGQMARISPMLIRFYEGATSEHDATPQDLSRRSYFRHPTRQDVRELYRHGHRFLDRRDLAAVQTSLERLSAP